VREPDPREIEVVMSLRRWARAEVPDPVPWGEVERRLLAEERPTDAELEAMFPRTHPASVLLAVFLLPQLALVGAAVVGLGFVVAYVGFDAGLSDEWAFLVNVVFVLAVLAAAYPLLAWYDSRRRDAFGLVLSGGSAVASAASWVLLGSESGSDPWGTVRVLAAVGAVVGAVVFLLLLVAGRPAVSAPAREWRVRVSPEEQWLRGLRATVLETLQKRGLVDRRDVPSLVNMPAGTWHEVETMPDGRVRRRTGG
jgi:hypothetical protein